MNKRSIVSALSLVVLFFGFALTAKAQAKAKKPRVVVVPSDRLRQAFSIDDQDEGRMSVSQSMMPLFNEQGRAVDARVFYRELSKYLKSLGLTVEGPRSGATASGMTGALGSAVLTIK